MGDFGYPIVLGSPFSHEQIRQLAWTAVAGRSGVATRDSLRVVATSPPSTQVTISPGHGILANGALPESVPFPDANPAQSYLVPSPRPVTVTVPANTTGSVIVRELWVVARDPQYAGMSVDPTRQDDYLDVVWRVFGESAPTGPRMLLARITIPANTATITQAMIADPRQLVNPRQENVTAFYNVQATQQMISGSATWWSSPSFAPPIPIPAWARTCDVAANVMGAVYNGTTSSLKGYPLAGGDTNIATATTRVKIGGAYQPLGGTDNVSGIMGPQMTFTQNASQAIRFDIVAAAVDLDVTTMAGTTQSFSLHSQGVSHNTGAPNPWYCDNRTWVRFQVTFKQ